MNRVVVWVQVPAADKRAKPTKGVHETAGLRCWI